MASGAHRSCMTRFAGFRGVSKDKCLLVGSRAQHARSLGQIPKGVRSGAAPARLVVGGLGCFVFKGVVVLVVLWDFVGCIF